MFSPSNYYFNVEKDDNSDDDDTDEARKEIEIALYSQIHYEVEEGAVEQNFADLSYEFQVYRASSDALEGKVPELQSSSSQKENLTVVKERPNRGGKNQPIDCDKPRSGNEDCMKVQTCSALNFLPLDESVDSEFGGAEKEVLISSEDECIVEHAIEVSSESVVELESEDELSSLDENNDFDSDCMMLDESMSENEEIQVNVHDNQRKLLKKRSQAEMEKWKILDADLFGEAPVYTTNRYYGNSFTRCHNCRDFGHMVNECPKPQKMEICILCGVTGHHYRKCPESLCYNCNAPGHTSKECASKKKSLHYICFRCNMKGHDQKVCPDLWRQFHLTIDKDRPLRGDNEENPRVFCCNCGEGGHFGYECEEEWIDRHSTATYPLVAKYDHKIRFKQAKRKKGNSVKRLSKRKRRKMGAPADERNVTDMSRSEGVTDWQSSKLRMYSDGMKRIVDSLESSSQLEPVIHEAKKKKKKKSKKKFVNENQSEKSKVNINSVGKVRRGNGKKKSKSMSKTDNVEKTSVSNNFSKSSKNFVDSFPRTGVSTEFGHDTGEVHHQAFNNEWWCKVIEGKGGRKKGKNKNKVNDSADLSNFNRGFRTKILPK